jgi:hypothetical protein
VGGGFEGIGDLARGELIAGDEEISARGSDGLENDVERGAAGREAEVEGRSGRDGRLSAETERGEKAKQKS